MMEDLAGTCLDLAQCPHCRVDTPMLVRTNASVTTHSSGGGNPRIWVVFACHRCGGAVLAGGHANGRWADEVYPGPGSPVSDALPTQAQRFLRQAIGGIHTAPDLAQMGAASAIDSMLKGRGLTEGVLYARIQQAQREHMITEDMAAWAHDVRLDANDQRHADLDAAPATIEDAQRCVDFAMALAEYLYILPSKVRAKREEAEAAAREGAQTDP